MDYFLNKPKKISQNLHLNVEVKSMPKQKSFIYKSHDNLRECVGEQEKEIQSPYQNFFKSKVTNTPLRTRKSIKNEEDQYEKNQKIKEKKLHH